MIYCSYSVIPMFLSVAHEKSILSSVTLKPRGVLSSYMYMYANFCLFVFSLARHLSPGSLQSGKTLRDHKVTPPTSKTTQTAAQATPTPTTNHTPSLDEATPTATPPPPGHGRCSYCGSVMPSLRLIMHERHCAQSTYKCPLCQ